MNNSIDGSSGMTPDSSMAQSNGYNEAWANMSPYSQSPYNNSPMNEYAHWHGYIPHGLPSESLGRMPPPPPQPQQHSHQMMQAQPHMGHHQLPMLNTGAHWPSELTNPTPSGSYSAPPLSMPHAPLASNQSMQSVAPVSHSATAETPKTPAPPEKARRTLSIEQKRAMCQYAEDNPGMKQAEIGTKFGVERSTVSKVLRHKEQYLRRDTEVDLSAKKAKGKHPDFDRTLSNYVKIQQGRGLEVKDEEIMEQARLFARVGDNQENLMSSLSGSWLQKFKARHGLGTSRLTRRASETNIPDSTRRSPARPKLKKERSMGGISKSKTNKDKSSGVISPSSPTGTGQLSPRSETLSNEEMQPEGLGLDFTYRQAGSHSTTSLTNDTGNSSFSGGALSPTGTFTFSPDPNSAGGFAFEHPREKRSNTFPSLNIAGIHEQSSTEPQTPRHPSSATASSALESPAQDLSAGVFPIDTTLTSPPTLHRSGSNSSMSGRPSGSTAPGTGVNSTPIEASPVSPSQEDARRAANTLLSYMSNHGQFDQNEYLALMQLTKKLQLQQHQQQRPSIGGLSRIPEGDSEMHGVHGLVIES